MRLKHAAGIADYAWEMPELSVKPARPPGSHERERRAEALRLHRSDKRAQKMATAGELAYLRAQLRVAGRLTARLAAMRDVDDMVRLVVDELHSTFAFYLAAIQRLDDDGVLRLVAGRGPLADVMTEFLLVEQPVSEGVNGRVARTGTTALGQLVSADPQFRSLRTWESQAPTPPPEAATQHTDPRIAQAAEGIAMIDQMFPDFRTMNSFDAESATECQDLMGMSFRTFHFDGVVRVPGYVEWLLQTDMRETYTFHRDVLKLLQWHCKPNLWHLRTPVHMFALESFVEAYPNAKFLWSHRDPAKVLGSVCSLIAYVRSWSSDRRDPEELGAEQLAWWAEGTRRAMDFRSEFGDDRFVDVSFAALQTDPIDTIADSYEKLGLRFTDSARARVRQWADGHKPGHHGTHSYELADYGLTPEQVHKAFGDYIDTYDASA